jgi:hypothetical protein
MQFGQAAECWASILDDRDRDRVVGACSTGRGSVGVAAVRATQQSAWGGSVTLGIGTATLGGGTFILGR